MSLIVDNRPRIPDNEDPKVEKIELDSIELLNKNIGDDFYIKKNDDEYEWDAAVYKLNKTEKYLQWNFCGYVELEHATERGGLGKAEYYKNFSEWRLLSKKFYVKTDDNADLTNIEKDNLDRCLYLKYTSDYELSFIIPMDYAIKIGTHCKDLKRRDGTSFFPGMKEYQKYYIAIDPDEFVTEEAPNILTKKDKCVQYIREFFGNKEPMVYGSKRRRIKGV